MVVWDSGPFLLAAGGLQGVNGSVASWGGAWRAPHSHEGPRLWNMMQLWHVFTATTPPCKRETPRTELCPWGRKLQMHGHRTLAISQSRWMTRARVHLELWRRSRAMDTSRRRTDLRRDVGKRERQPLTALEANHLGPRTVGTDAHEPSLV